MNESIFSLLNEAYSLCSTPTPIEEFLLYIFFYLSRKTNFYVVVTHKTSGECKGFWPLEARAILLKAFESQTSTIMDAMTEEILEVDPQQVQTERKSDNRRLENHFYIAKKVVNRSLKLKNDLSDSEILMLASKVCKKRKRNRNEFCSTYGCLAKIFADEGSSSGINQSQLINHIREVGRFMGVRSTYEQDQHLIRLFKSCVISSDASDVTRLQMSYKINETNICLHCFVFFHGTTTHIFEKCAKLIKHSEDNDIGSLSHLPYTDNTSHDFNYGETEQMLKENNCSLSLELARFSQAPLSTKQLFCISWMNNYFGIHCDEAPNRSQRYISLTEKIEIYDQYCNDYSKYSPPIETVSYGRFLQIWKAVFPAVVIREYCEVIGKCSTCYNIDHRRQAPKLSLKEAEALKIAHHIHRTGLVMPERSLYHDRIEYALRKNTEQPGNILISSFFCNNRQWQSK
jgi:hypothetical protein